MLVGKRSTWKFPHEIINNFQFFSKPKTLAFFTLYPYFLELLLKILSSKMQLTFAPARLRKSFIKKFNLDRKICWRKQSTYKISDKTINNFRFSFEIESQIIFHIRTLFYKITIKRSLDILTKGYLTKSTIWRI